MRLLALDIGSSTVKAAVLTRDGSPRSVIHVGFATRYSEAGGSPRAEVKLIAIERAVRAAIRELGPGAKRVDRIVADTMSPSWLALDASGRALTNVVTHQDRRSVAEASAIETRVGKARHLRLTGNRPFPGGISSTTLAWHLAHQADVMRRAALVGHLGTWLTQALTDARVVDRSNAGFTGLMDARTCDWSDDLIEAVGVERALLPRIVESDAIVGTVTSEAARRFGLQAGTPVVAGCVDGSAAMLAAGGMKGVRAGQIVNVSGSTDVLAVCTLKPHPHDQLLARPLGVDGKWLSVGTIAAAGSALQWVHRTFFSELTESAFFIRAKRIGRRVPANSLKFDATLAGSRTSMVSVTGRIEGLTLSTSRDEILSALLADLGNARRVRFDHFADAGVRIGRDMLVTGGGSAMTLGDADRFRRRTMSQATLRGLWTLATRPKST